MSPRQLHTITNRPPPLTNSRGPGTTRFKHREGLDNGAPFIGAKVLTRGFGADRLLRRSEWILCKRTDVLALAQLSN